MVAAAEITFKTIPKPEIVNLKLYDFNLICLYRTRPRPGPEGIPRQTALPLADSAELARGGEIAFGAVGFTQTLLAEPILTDKQHLSLRERSRLTRR